MLKRPHIRVPLMFLLILVVAIVLAFVELMRFAATDPVSFTESTSTFFFYGNSVVQAVALIVGFITFLASRSLKHEIRRIDHLKDGAGWLPIRSSHYVRGVAALIVSILLPLGWVGFATTLTFAQSQVCGVYDGTECSGMQWFAYGIILLMFAPGVILLTPITYMLGRDVLLAVVKVYDWPTKPRFSTHPALKIAQTMRQAQRVLLWGCLVLIVLFVLIVRG